EDGVEAAGLQEFFGARTEACAIGSVKAVIGHAGAAAGLASLVKTAVCLFQEMISPLPGFRRPRDGGALHDGSFHVPAAPSYWLRDRAEGPRRAGVSAMGIDGNCMHVVLEAHETAGARCIIERRQPLGATAEAIFVVGGDDVTGLAARLVDFGGYLAGLPGASIPIERVARQWHERMRPRGRGRLTACFVAGTVAQLRNAVEQTRGSIPTAPSKRLDGRGGAFYAPDPLAHAGQIAFVFPGSSNHFAGMGRDLGAAWPEVLRALDE